MKFLLAILVSSASVFAGVDGVVVNGTTGRTEPNVMVTLVQPGENGMQTIGSVKSDAAGKFNIDKTYPPGPILLQGLHGGVTYSQMITPGSPTSGVTLKVYDSTTSRDSAKVAQHFILLEPGAASLQISETFLCSNETDLTYEDPARGSIEFYVPAAAKDQVRVTVTPPGGMPISRPALKTAKPGVYKVDYGLKPGETRFDIEYSLPAWDTFRGKMLASTPVRLVTPASVTLTGGGIDSLGQEPQTQAHIYGVTAPDFAVKIEGTGSLRNPAASAQQPGDEDDGRPQVESSSARIYSRLGWVLGLTFAILAIGGVMLYRRGAA